VAGSSATFSPDVKQAGIPIGWSCIAINLKTALFQLTTVRGGGVA